MPSLEEVLRKTKTRSEQIKVVRKPPSIATDDRPEDDAPSPTNIAHIIAPHSLNSTAEPSGFFQEHIKEPQRGYKGDTKELQRDHKRATQGITKETQREHKRVTKGTPKGPHKGTQREHKLSSLYTQEKGVQREHKYSHLRGWNKKIVELIHDICRETVSRITHPLTNSFVSEATDIPKSSIKTTMQRLKRDGHVIVVEFNGGRSGWSRYTLPEEFFNEIPQTERVHKGVTKGTQRDYKGDTKGATQGDTNASSSSSDLKITTTSSSVEAEWQFDITPYRQFGFGQTQIKQLSSLGSISAVDVEQSLIEFTHDLENNALPRMKGNKINFLMGLLRAGHSYVSEGFQSAQESIISEMARRAETKRQNLLEAKFGAWEASLGYEERQKVMIKMPVHLMPLEKAHGIINPEVRQWYFDHFIRHIVEEGVE